MMSLDDPFYDINAPDDANHCAAASNALLLPQTIEAP